MPKFKHTKTGRIVNAVGRGARRYEALQSYEKVGAADVDKFADQEAAAEKAYADKAKKRTAAKKSS